jgi:hypothetical protein
MIKNRLVGAPQGFDIQKTITRSKMEMDKRKITIFLLAPFVAAWFLGCASTPEPAAQDQGVKFVVGGYVKGSATISTTH